MDTIKLELGQVAVFPDGIAISREVITPERAEELLGRNTVNRNVSKSQVATLVRTHEEGDWAFTGDPLRIDTEGVFIDGQHRCLMCVETGIPFETIVITGLPREVMKKVDTSHKARSLAEQLKILGVGDASAVAAGLNLHWKQERDLLSKNIRLTVPEGLREFAACPGIEKFFGKHMRGYKQNWRGAPSAYCLLAYEFAVADADAAEDFFERLETATRIEPDTALHALRRWMSSGNKHSNVSLMAVMIKAWNAHVKGEPVAQLMWRPVGPSAEKFPKIGE